MDNNLGARLPEKDKKALTQPAHAGFPFSSSLVSQLRPALRLRRRGETRPLRASLWSCCTGTPSTPEAARSSTR